MNPEERVVVFTRDDCHLCVEALEVVARVCDDLGEAWRTTDVDASDELRARYGDHVPVVEVDGVQQAFWRVDEARLRRSLTA